MAHPIKGYFVIEDPNILAVARMTYEQAIQEMSLRNNARGVLREIADEQSRRRLDTFFFTIEAILADMKARHPENG